MPYIALAQEKLHENATLSTVHITICIT